MSKTIIILGSSNSSGKTRDLVNLISKSTNIEVIDLKEYDINYFNYQYQNQSDDYIPLVSSLIEKYETFIFATPVYWYAMSGILKTFFDRLTDLLTIKKDLGRKLRGKNMMVITSAASDNLGELFWLPFEKTAGYLGMNFLGGIHTIENKDHSKEIKKIIDLIPKN